jgi:hypothetical protein
MERDIDLWTGAAAHVGRGHAVDLLQLRLDLIVDQRVGLLQRGPGIGVLDRQVQDREGAEVDRGDPGRLHAGRERQRADRGRDLGFGLVEVGAVGELRGHDGGVLRRGGGEGVDPRHARHGDLDGLGHVLEHGVGVGARVSRDDGDGVKADVRQQLFLHARGGEGAGHQQDQRDQDHRGPLAQDEAGKCRHRGSLLIRRQATEQTRHCRLPPITCHLWYVHAG